MEDNKMKDIIIVCEKGEKNMKERLIEYIKFGFGFYIGYNLAQALKDSIKKTNK